VRHRLSLRRVFVAWRPPPAATAGAIVGVTGAYAQAIVDGTVPLASDPSGRLADLANWGADILAANSGSTPTLALRERRTLSTDSFGRRWRMAARPLWSGSGI
jgi:hypothetical protein